MEFHTFCPFNPRFTGLQPPFSTQESCPFDFWHRACRQLTPRRMQPPSHLPRLAPTAESSHMAVTRRPPCCASSGAASTRRRMQLDARWRKVWWMMVDVTQRWGDCTQWVRSQVEREWD